MTTSLVVLRTSVLLMFLLIAITGLYVHHVTRLSADAAAQSGAAAAAQAAVAAGWQCQPTPPAEALTAAAQATLSHMNHLAVQPVAVEVFADACNLFTSVTAAPLGSRVSALHITAIACRSATQAATLKVPGSC
ncbi:hypothetical protein [Candidatus Poriferisocius sp.]|uniref:hypothetical protein n=1 Tax=Candidatus Poriferisocius sp. TaxID=3101276 RepID=UPI003B5CE2DE